MRIDARNVRFLRESGSRGLYEQTPSFGSPRRIASSIKEKGRRLVKRRPFFCP